MVGFFLTFSVSVVQLTNLYGPVPTGWRDRSLPNVLIAFGLRIDQRPDAPWSLTNAPNGCFSTIFTVYWSTTSILSDRREQALRA